MKKFKRAVAALLGAAMALSLVACGSSNSATTKAAETSASSGSGSDSTAAATTAAQEEDKVYDQVTFAYATFNNIPTEEDLDVVEEAINQITREKIGAEITLMPISIFEYSSKVSLALQGSEKIDVFESLGDFGTCIANDMCMDITDLWAQYGAETNEVIPASWFDACKYQGQLYGVPTYKPIALTPMVIYRKDIAEELNIDMSKVNSLEDVTAVLEQVEAAKPDMTPLAPVQAGNLGTVMTIPEVDYLNDDYYQPIGVLMGDSLTVTDLYSTDEFYKICSFARNLYNNDLVMKDAATTTSAAAELMASGNYFCYIAAYSYPEEDTAASLQAQMNNYSVGAKIIGDAYLSTSDINALTWMVSSTTDVPEAAVKFLNLTMTDEDIINLVIYGIEGRDYVLDADGCAAYPEGQDASTVPYTAQLSCGTFGNFFKMYPTAGTDPASIEWELEQNEKAEASPAMGFTFDASELTTEYTAVKNVISQYLPGLLTGSLDPDTEIAKFVDALNAAGYQTILTEKQNQLDAWAATK